MTSPKTGRITRDAVAYDSIEDMDAPNQKIRRRKGGGGRSLSRKKGEIHDTLDCYPRSCQAEDANLTLKYQSLEEEREKPSRVFLNFIFYRGAGSISRPR